MWEKLPNSNKDRYRNLITNFASLSEAFAQKAEQVKEDDDQEVVEEKIAPIINSKYQETAFGHSFNAAIEDIANSSYDASIKLSDNEKYLVGIKSFGIGAGDQKIAQFKASSKEWTDIIAEIPSNGKGLSKAEINEVNDELYLELATKIAILRNERIRSSKEQLKGFKISEDDTNVEAVYHVLMPSKKGHEPKVYVGETSYTEIDIDNIEILGTTSDKNPANFRFSDGKHTYKYTFADSQLYMSFNNKDIVVDQWDVEYVEDALAVFEELGNIKFDSPKESYSWLINIEPYSGFNGFYGAPKMAKKDKAREKRIERLKDKYSGKIASDKLADIIALLEDILLIPRKGDERAVLVKNREKLMSLAQNSGSSEIIKELRSIVYRPANEMYIPIPSSRKFHEEHPNFFGMGICELNGSKLVKKKEERKFILRIKPAGDEIEAYVNQDYGKGIQSTNNQGILGEWILRKVFQLPKGEPLTKERLNELEINGIRLTKADEHTIELEFIWIDKNNLPKDYWK